MVDQLTVDVKGSNGEPYVNADVSIDQTSTSGKTDSKGEVILELPSSVDQVTVVVKQGNEIVQTPFYIRPDGARKLTIDFPYLQHQITQQANQNNPQQFPTPAFAVGAVVIVIIIAVIILKLRGRQKQQAVPSKKMEGVLSYHPVLTS